MKTFFENKHNKKQNVFTKATETSTSRNNKEIQQNNNPKRKIKRA